jgi:tetratricopeptide (TPR) repeat protein
MKNGMTLLLLLAIAAAVMAEDPPTIEQAATAVVAACSGGNVEDLRALAARTEPDPWLIADELLGRGQGAAALAFARAASGKDTEGLPAYVGSRAGKTDDLAAREALKAAAALEDRPAGALAVLAKIKDDAPGVVGARVSAVRGACLEAMGRSAEASEEFLRAARLANAIDWKRAAATAMMQSATNAEDALPDQAAARWDEAIRLQSLRDRPGVMAEFLGKRGLYLYRVGDKAGAIEQLTRSAQLFESVGDREGLQTALLNLGIFQRDSGRLEKARQSLTRALELAEELGQKRSSLRSLLALGRLFRQAGANGEARGYLERALNLAGETHEDALAAISGAELAAVLLDLHQTEEALSVFTRTIPLLERFPNLDWRTAPALADAGVACFLLGDCEGALNYARRAIDFARARGMRDCEAAAVCNLANANLSLGNCAAALVGYRQALVLYEAIGNPSHVASILVNLGMNSLLVSDLTLSLEWSERALAIAKSCGDLRIAASALSVIASVRSARGSASQAVSAFEQALDLARAAEDPERLAVVLADYGHCLLEIGDHTRAKDLFGRALSIARESGLPAIAASTTGFLGATLSREGNFASAREHLEQGVRLLESMGHRPGCAAILTELGACHLLAGEDGPARECFDRVLRLHEEMGDRIGAALALGQIGYCHFRAGRYQEAVECEERSLTALRELAADSFIPPILGFLASSLLRLGENARALETAREAARSFALFSGGLADEEGAKVREKFNYIYDAGLVAAARLKDIDSAVYFIESGRAAVLRESLGAQGRLQEALVPAELKSALSVARGEEAAAANLLRREIEGGVLALIKRRRAVLDEARERVRLCVERIQRESKASSDLLWPAPDALLAIRSRLAPGEAMVLYGIGEDEVVAVVATSEEVRLVPLGPRRAIESAVAALDLRSPDRDPAAVVEELTKLLIQPLALGGSVRRLLISPQGTLSDVPFSLLFPGQVACVPSGTTYGVLLAQGAQRGSGVLALGDPDYSLKVEASPPVAQARGGRLAALPATREEAKAVGDVLLLSDEATETALARALAGRPRWRALHLACHGLIEPERPAFSCLAMTPDSGSDGLLTCLEVFRMQVPADLAVLSACETAKGKVYRSEGILGLTRAFMMAGVPRVICSLWKVDDEATRALMTKFYELWNPKEGRAGLPTAEALKAAQAFVRSQEKWAHPFYWAAWVLWGLPE